MRIIGWIIFLYLLYRFVNNILGASRRRVPPKPGETTIRPERPETRESTTEKDPDEGEYIDYKEIK